MKCYQCSSTKITYYKQRRKDGKYIVTARCENNHIPVKGKPFYPLYKFDVNKLPLLGSVENKENIDTPVIEIKRLSLPGNLIEYVEFKKNLKFPY